MITLDSSAVFALLNRRDPDHRRVKAALEQDRGPYLIPAAILGEIAYLVEERLGNKAMDLFLGDLASGGFSLDCGEDELPRGHEARDPTDRRGERTHPAGVVPLACRRDQGRSFDHAGRRMARRQLPHRR